MEEWANEGEKEIILLSPLILSLKFFPFFILLVDRSDRPSAAREPIFPGSFNVGSFNVDSFDVDSFDVDSFDVGSCRPPCPLLNILARQCKSHL